MKYNLRKERDLLPGVHLSMFLTNLADSSKRFKKLLDTLGQVFYNDIKLAMYGQNAAIKER